MSLAFLGDLPPKSSKSLLGDTSLYMYSILMTLYVLYHALYNLLPLLKLRIKNLYHIRMYLQHPFSC